MDEIPVAGGLEQSATSERAFEENADASSSQAVESQGLDLESQDLERSSEEYVGRWHRLVSTTNWEKGRIICEWRRNLIERGAPSQEFSDEAWSRRVGGVSPQHVGRLRRVYERFGSTHDQYPGLYWSHFHAALEWPEAEMWLEGAMHNRWSVAQMRTTRWEALGGAASGYPHPDVPAPGGRDQLDEQVDEDVDPTIDMIDGTIGGCSVATVALDADATTAAIGDSVVQALLSAACEPGTRSTSEPAAAESAPQLELEELPSLPADLARAFRSLKRAILHHKREGWREVSCEQVLAALESLHQLALRR